MRRQIQKPSNESSPRNHGFLEPPRTPPLAADVRSRQNDDVGSGRFSFGDLRSFYRKLCEEEMAKISPIASPLQSESPGFLFPPRRAARISAGSAFTSASSSPSAAAAGGGISSPASTVPTAEEIGGSERDVVVIVTYSMNPCEEFRRSMVEMVAARVESGGEVDREFMEDLLFRYLELNNNKFFRDILHAFLEVIGVLQVDSGKTSRRRRWSGAFSKKKLKLEIKNMRKLCSKYRC